MLKQIHHNFFTVGFKSLRFLYVTKKQKTPQLWCLLFFWPTRSTFCVFSTFYLAYCGLFTVNLSSTLLPKNSPPDCFLNGRLQIPSFSLYIKIKNTAKGVFYFLAHPKGFEPPFSRIGICCVIQLRHGWIFSRIFIRLFIFN